MKRVLFLLLAVSLSVMGCKKDPKEPAKAPTVATGSVSNITTTSFECEGNVSADGGAAVTDRGVCYAMSSAPTISNDKVSGGSGTGSFKVSIGNLTPGKVYHARAYATNSAGTAYGQAVKVTLVKVVEGIAVSPTEKSVVEGEKFKIQVTFSPADVPNKAVTWSSDKSEVASVDSNGEVTTHKEGSATITATSVDGGKTATCRVTVKRKEIKVTGITVSPTEKSVMEGESFTITATVLPSDADNKNVTWHSSSAAIASVDTEGHVMAHKPGRATITARTADGNKEAACMVTVKKKVIRVTGVTVSPTEKSVVEGETFTITATVQPSDADNKSVAWSSSAESIASVNNQGKVTTHKPGKATITATTADGGKTATCQVTVNKKVIRVTGITVSPTEKSVVEGESFTITATVEPADADNKAVIWSSSASDIASVNDQGRVTAHKPGKATITATTVDGGKTATCQVTVNKKVIRVTGVTVSPTEKSVVEGETFTITATVQPSDADNKSVAWSSSAESIASVNNQGKVTTHKPGKATITATTADGGKTATCQVTVNKKVIRVTGITVSPIEKSVVEGETFTITATVEPADADNKAITWSSSASDIASVNNQGKVTTHKPGKAIITATSVDGGKTATCRVTVKRKEVKVTGITVSPTEKSVKEGEAFTITAIVLPADADNKTVTWSSSASDIASVNDNGRVTTHKPGRATITATTADGGKTATCQVTVTKKEVKVTGITVSPTEKSVIEGESFTITATVQPADADNKAVRWSSSAESIASVNNQGKVTTHKPGKATITATTEDGGKTAGCEVTVKSKITEEYKALKKKAEEMEGKTDDAKKELAGIKSSDKSINEKIKLMEALLKKINGIKSEIDSLSDEIEAKKDLLHESEYNELKEKKESLLSGIAELQSEAETYKQKLDKAAKEGKGDLSDLEIVDL